MPAAPNASQVRFDAPGGRLGAWFASKDIFDDQPDIIVTAKGITSGNVPLGATLLSDAIHDVISRPQCKGGVFSMGLTYFGHPVDCAAAQKNIESIERENLLANATILGAHLQTAAKALLNLDIVGDVRGMGLMLGVDLVPNRTTKALLNGASEAILKGCVERGVIVRPVGSRIIGSLPLVIDKTECDMIVRAVWPRRKISWRCGGQSGAGGGVKPGGRNLSDRDLRSGRNSGLPPRLGCAPGPATRYVWRSAHAGGGDFARLSLPQEPVPQLGHARAVQVAGMGQKTGRAGHGDYSANGHKRPAGQPFRRQALTAQPGLIGRLRRFVTSSGQAMLALGLVGLILALGLVSLAAHQSEHSITSYDPLHMDIRAKLRR